MGVSTRFRRLAALPDTAEERSPYIILAVICSAVFLDFTIALPTIQTDLHTSQSQLQWAISAYSLTFGSFLLLGGRGGDLFGHRRVLLFGSCVFGLFSLICALSPTFIGLAVARAFQGIGAGFTIPSAQAHIVLYFPDPKGRAKALGLWAAAGSVGFIVGLVLGGVLTALLTWRWIFWVSLILSGVIVPAIYLLTPRRKKADDEKKVPSAAAGTDPTNNISSVENITHAADEHTKQQKSFTSSLRARLIKFDALGISLGVPGLLLLTYALTSGNTSGWGSASIISTLVIAVVLLAAFIFNETRAPDPLLQPRLFRSASFDLTLVLAVVTFAVRQGVTYFLTIQLQSFGNSALHTAVLFIPTGVSALIANTIFGRLVPLLGARLMFVLGWALVIPGTLLFSFVQPGMENYWRFTFPAMIIYIAGIGAVYITANFVVVSAASKWDQGVVAGIFNVALQVGGSVVGLAVLTAVADAINERFGTGGDSNLSSVGYRSVYYSCAILAFVALLLSLFAVEVPEAMRGSIWKKKEEEEEKSDGGGNGSADTDSITNADTRPNTASTSTTITANSDASQSLKKQRSTRTGSDKKLTKTSDSDSERERDLEDDPDAHYSPRQSAGILASADSHAPVLSPMSFELRRQQKTASRSRNRGSTGGVGAGADNDEEDEDDYIWDSDVTRAGSVVSDSERTEDGEDRGGRGCRG